MSAKTINAMFFQTIKFISAGMTILARFMEISLDDLQAIPLGGNVHYKPGALLVKIQTDPKVYAVGANGNLRWVRSEAIARALYGSNWNKLVDDVPDSFLYQLYGRRRQIESES
jgi:hypothetical protein